MEEETYKQRDATVDDEDKLGTLLSGEEGKQEVQRTYMQVDPSRSFNLEQTQSIACMKMHENCEEKV